MWTLIYFLIVRLYKFGGQNGNGDSQESSGIDYASKTHELQTIIEKQVI